MRILTLNAQNLRLRRGGGGDGGGPPRFDGARDRDTPGDDTPAAAALDLADRRLTAQVLARARADVISLQEVFDRETLDYFHDHLMRAARAPAYPHRACLRGNDGGGRNLAVLSRHPWEALQSHAGLMAAGIGRENPSGVAPETPVFRRDCLSLRIGALTLFLCHFKAPWPDPQAAWPVRRLEAEALRWLIARRCGADPGALWLILGDLNEPEGPGAPGSALAPLVADGFAVDLMVRIPQGQRWTFHEPGAAGRYGRPDAFLASPALAARWPGAVPQVLREGLSRDAARHAGPRLPDVGAHRPHASDHAAVMLDLPGL